MRHSNNVHLDGAISWCRIAGEKNGVVVARLNVFTLHPKGPDLTGYRPSEKFEKMFHRVRVTVGGEQAKRLKDIETLCCNGKEGFVNELLPVSVDGSLAVVDGSPAVDVRGNGFKFAERVPNENNNRVALSGVVLDTTFTDKVAFVNLDVDGVGLRVQMSKSTNPKGWEAVRSKALQKGDEISLEGPLLSNRYINGKDMMFSCTVAAREIVLPKLSKEEKRSKGGVSL